MNNLLILDTSTRTTVLGLQTEAGVLDRTVASSGSHSRNILPAIDSLLQEAGLSRHDLDALVFGRGPGSFTGLRIATGVVQGLGYGLGIPVVPVSSMAAIAQSAWRRGAVEGTCALVSLTARLEEIYFGSYVFDADGIALPLNPEGVADVSQLETLPEGDWLGLGDGWQFREKIEQATGVKFRKVLEGATPAVSDLLRLGVRQVERGELVPALEASPVYLREEVASKPGS